MADTKREMMHKALDNLLDKASKIQLVQGTELNVKSVTIHHTSNRDGSRQTAFAKASLNIVIEDYISLLD
jgi:hypothetical protein